VYFQTAQLAKIIFKEGSLKVDRVNPEHEDYQCVASFSTMEAYRQIWNNFGKYLREVWDIRNFEKVESIYVEDYIDMKISDGCSKQYIEKISAAFSKLEIALRKFNAEYANRKIIFNFKKKSLGIALHKKSGKLESNCQNRAYSEPEKIIGNLDNPLFKLAASIQYEGGARYKGIKKIKMNHLKGTRVDEVSSKLVGVIETKEKGGRIGDVLVSIDTYKALKKVLEREKVFKIDYRNYARAIRDCCLSLGVECHGSHGFRWNFTKKRLIEYQNIGYSYDDSLSKVSFEMKHNRKIITEHYLG